MKDKIEFQRMLNCILEEAKEQGGSISSEKIKEYFKDMDLNDEQMSQIYQYFVQYNITIKGIEFANSKEDDNVEGPLNTKKNTGNQTKEEDKKIRDTISNGSFFLQYLMEMEKSSSYDKQQITQWFQEAREVVGRVQNVEVQDESVKNQDINKVKIIKEKIIKAYLPLVVAISKEYNNMGLGLDDLIQEGNFGLLEAVTNLLENHALKNNRESFVFDSEVNVDEYIAKSIKRQIYEYVKWQKEGDEFVQKLVEKNNEIIDAMKELEEMEGSKVSLSQLSAFMEISEEEIMETLQFAGEEV